jgi:hypothetical protein
VKCAQSPSGNAALGDPIVVLVVELVDVVVTDVGGKDVVEPKMYTQKQFPPPPS